MQIVLIGIQGSGKGELIKNLSKVKDFTYVSVGALFRQEIAKRTALGKFVEPIMARGDLPDLQTTMKVVKKAIKNAKGDLVFDGFPRTTEQADALDKICKVDIAIYLKLNKSVAKKRLLNRLTCVNCQHITSKDKVKTLTCPVCGGKLATRHDDTTTSIDQRFKVFEEVTMPLIKRYKTQGVLHQVDASKTIQEVFEEVKKVLNECPN